MISSINSRINELVVFFCDGNNSRFAEIVGTSEANIRNYRSKTLPSLHVLVAICSKFEISYEWILTGKGSMTGKLGVVGENTMLTCSSKKIEVEAVNKYLKEQVAEKDRLIAELNQQIGVLKDRIAKFS